MKTLHNKIIKWIKVTKGAFVVLPRHLTKDWNKIYQSSSLDTSYAPLCDLRFTFSKLACAEKNVAYQKLLYRWCNKTPNDPIF